MRNWAWTAVPVLAFLAPAAFGATVEVVDVEDQGFYRLEVGDDNYVTDGGTNLNQTGHESFTRTIGHVVYRSFYVFQIPDLAGSQITGARLYLSTGQFADGQAIEEDDPVNEPGVWTSNPALDLGFYAVDTSVSDLTARSTTNAAGIFDDLGSGDLYGSFDDVPAKKYNTTSGIVIEVDLSGALNDLELASGGYFAIGAAVPLTNDELTSSDYGGTSGFSVFWGGQEIPEPNRLELDLETALVPTPTAAGAATLGLLSMGTLLRRRRGEALSD